MGDPERGEDRRETGSASFESLPERARSPDGRVAVYARPGSLDRLSARGILEPVPARRLAGLRPTGLGGRGEVFEWSEGNERWLLKTLRHGGGLGPLLGNRYLRDDRLARVVELHHRLATQGLRVPEVVFARTLRRRSLGLRLELCTVRVEDSLHLLDWMRTGDAAQRRRALESVGRGLRRLHEIGLHHKDLNARNLLVGRTDPGPWILDLEGSSLCARLSEDRRLGVLLRLLRSLAKAQARPTGEELDVLLRAYADEDGARLLTELEQRWRLERLRHRWAWPRRYRTLVSSNDLAASRTSRATPWDGDPGPGR